MPDEEDVILKRGGTAVALDEEGGIYPTNIYAQKIDARFQPHLISDQQTYWAWGETQAGHMKALPNRFRDGQIMVTGNPRFDICKREMREFHHKLDPGLASFGPFIQINTNFSPYNSKLLSEKRHESEERLAWYEYHKEMFGEFLELIRTIREKFPEANLVIRPHPVENPKTYRDAFPSDGRLRVDALRRPVSRACASASLVIHHDCTTAVEALFGGHIPISFAPLPLSEKVQALPLKVSNRCGTKDEVCGLIQERLKGQPEEIEWRNKMQHVAPFIRNHDSSFFSHVKSFLNDVSSRTQLTEGQVRELSIADRARIGVVAVKMAGASLVGKKGVKEPKFTHLEPKEVEIMDAGGKASGVISEGLECQWLSGTLMMVRPKS